MSKTKENLKAAFIGESMVRNKYYFFAQIARKEGYHYIAKILEETAENEKFHALEEFKLLHGEKDTVANLKEAVSGETYESEEMYPKFAREAEAEGNRKAAALFSQIVKIEKIHQERFKKILELIENGKVYKRDEPIRWKCSICGDIINACEPPETCPYCNYPREYYEPANLDV